VRALLPLLIALGLALAEPVEVAAASSLGPALREIAAAFLEAYGTPVRVVLGSSGKLRLKVKHGAPFDLYLPANPAYLERLELKAAPTFARGQLVLYLKKEGLPEGPKALADPRVRRVALANPMHAPYGAAAVMVMQRFGVLELVRPKLVYTESVAQAARVSAFAADAGWLDLGSARKLPGHFWVAPPGSYPPLVYRAGLLRDHEEARRFLAFLVGEEAQVILRRHGFLPP